jgi:hypothetical protein
MIPDMGKVLGKLNTHAFNESVAIMHLNIGHM